MFIYSVLHRSLLDEEGEVLRGQITGSGHMAMIKVYANLIHPQGENFR